MAHDTTSRRLARLLPAFGALIGAIAGTSPASAQRVEAGQAPAAWLAYAQLVSDAVKARLAGDDPVAVRFKAYLDASRSDPAQPPLTLALKLWIDAKGAITKAEFPPFAHEEANSDLTSLLVGRAIGSTPPKGMLLPLRLTLQLQPAPAKDVASPA